VNSKTSEKEDLCLQMENLLYKKTGNTYKLLPYNLKAKFCDFYRDEKQFLPEVRAVSDIPEPDVCPWPAGVYHIYGYTLNFELFPPVVLPQAII
jgi:hypothetical protein